MSNKFTEEDIEELKKRLYPTVPESMRNGINLMTANIKTGINMLFVMKQHATLRDIEGAIRRFKAQTAYKY